MTALRALDPSAALDVPMLRRPIVIAAVLALGALLILGGSWWWVAILAVAAVVGSRARPRVGPASGDVALAADLMAACLTAGAGIADALAAATAAAGPNLSAQADPVIEELRRGSPPELAWSPWLTDDNTAPVARSCIRSAGSGAAIASELARVAARMRARQRAVLQERVARASVWVVLPLGLCFLPAFVLVGVVPLVLGLLHNLR